MALALTAGGGPAGPGRLQFGGFEPPVAPAQAASGGVAVAKAPAALCNELNAVLSDGPDPGADPVGYALSQILPLQQQVHSSDTSVMATVTKLDRGRPGALQLQRGRQVGRRHHQEGLHGHQQGLPGSRPMTRPCSQRARGALLAVSLAAGLLVAGHGSGRSGRRVRRSLTLYSGQHVQTTQALVNAFEKKTGITVNVRFDDEDVLADQIVTEGTHSPADVFFTENSPPLQYLASKHLLAPVKASTLAKTPSKYNSPKGMWVGVSARVSVMVYNTVAAQAEPAADLGHAAGRAPVEGQDRHRRRRDRLPAHRDLGGAHLRRRGRAQVARRRSRPTRAATSTPTTRPSPTRSTGARSPSASSTSTTGTASGPRSARPTCTRPSPTSRRTTSATWSTSRARPSCARRQHEAEAQKLVAFLNSAQGQEIIAHSESFEYPIASGVTTAQPETPFNQLQPNSITIAQLGTGAEAIKLLQEAQLL